MTFEDGNGTFEPQSGFNGQEGSDQTQENEDFLTSQFIDSSHETEDLVDDDFPDGSSPATPGGQPPVDPQDPQGKRFAYWQSEAMRTQNELKTLRQQMELTSPYMPIVRYIQENPTILETIEQEITRGGQQKQPDGLQVPVAPQRPMNYNSVEAYSDPESESFKYREAHEQYRDELANYFLKKEQMREAEYRAAQEERAFIEQRNQQLGQIAQQVITKYGLSEDQAVEFIRLYDDPKAVTLDRLIQLYRFEKGLSAPVPQGNLRGQQVQNRQMRNMPLPGGINGGQHQKQMTEEESFNDSIVQYAKNQSSVLWRNKQR